MFKVVNDCISDSKKNTDSTWYELFTEIYKIAALDSLNPPLLRSKELCHSEYDTFEHFLKTKEYNNQKKKVKLQIFPDLV